MEGNRFSFVEAAARSSARLKQVFWGQWLRLRWSAEQKSVISLSIAKLVSLENLILDQKKTPAEAGA